MKRFYQLVHEEGSRSASIDIYGDITSWEWFDSDVSAHTIHTDINGLDVDNIDVFINSCGGEVFEALGIYETLKRHKANIHTYCDGIAASAASVIFCAGNQRTISNVGLLMIHNAWTWASGNADQLRKAADDLEKITQPSINAYKAVSNLSEEEIKKMMDEETFMSAEEALEYGFATDISNVDEEGVKQSALSIIKCKVAPVQPEEVVDLESIIKDSVKEAIKEYMQKEEPKEPEIKKPEEKGELTAWDKFFKRGE